MNDPDGKKPARPSTARITIWIAVSAIALWMIGSGVVGLLTHR